MRIALAAVGFTSTIAQVLLMRELVATFYGNELLFGLVLTAWLAWVALGSWGLGRIPLHSSLPHEGVTEGGRRIFAAGLALAAVLLPAQMAGVRGARILLGITPGAFVGLGPMAAATVLLLAPLCLLGGFLFTLGARLMAERGGPAGRAYVWESIGAVFGGALFSFALIRWLDPFQTALLVAAVNLSVALFLFLSPNRSRIYALLLLILLLAAVPLGRALHRATLRWQWSDLILAADSPYGRLTIQARAGQRIFYQNGLLAFETQGTFPEEVAHFPLLSHPDPQDVLLIGGGVAGDLREALKHPVESVTYVELDPLLIEAARSHLPPEEAAVLDDPRVRLALTDGRLFVKRTPRAFDVIILDLPEPSTGALNRFYTREFFAEVQAILKQDGILSLGLPSAENYWSPELARRNGSVYQTLKSVFAEVMVLPGEHNFYLASDAPLPTDYAMLTRRMAERDIEARWMTPSTIEYIFTTDRFEQVEAELEAAQGVRLNRDLTPICYYYDLALWLSRFYPRLRGAFVRASLLNLWWVALPLALIVLLTRWRRGWAVPFTIASIGLAEMTLEVVIIFAFQVLHGTVYREVSLIVTAFMAGLAAGGGIGQRLIDRHWPRADRRRNARRMLLAVQGAVTVYGGFLPLIISLPIHAPTVIFPLLALITGGFAGMAFPLAMALMQGDEGRKAGLLYGADLVGGCVGALLSSALLVPMLGIPRTCAALALVGLGGLLALV